MAPLFVTRLIIFTPSTLYRAAWSALMSNQPNIVLTGSIDQVAGLEGLAQKGPGATILVDLPAPQPELAGQLFFFCADGCRRDFLADPARFVSSGRN